MTETATTNVLTPDFIRMMIRPTKSVENSPAFVAQQQSWIWRSLLYCHREMRRDIKQYRTDMGRVENRNSPAYWIDWMSNGRLGKNSDAADIHKVILEDQKDPPRTLSRQHLENAVTFLTTEGVAETIIKFIGK